MAEKKVIKVRYVELNTSQSSFVSKFIGTKKEHDFSDVKLLRKLLSNEKARILHLLRHKNPSSIYQLAKMLQRDLKSVRTDLKLLERFGFIDYEREKKGKRMCLRPVLTADTIQIEIHV